MRVPGRAYLATTPKPTTKQFNAHAYWRLILKELAHAYGEICAYSSFWVPPTTGADTVEHYEPKVPHPERAYEWTNYRFVCQRLNNRKGKKEDVVDPFAIGDGWFGIDFPSLLVKPSPILTTAQFKQVESTIKRLGLNDMSTCWDQREGYVRDYCLGVVNFAFVIRNAPFLAAEIQRQGLVNTLNIIMGYTPEDDPYR